LLERRCIAEIISLHVRDGHLEQLAAPGRTREGSIRTLDSNMDLAAEEAQTLVAQHRARQQPRLEQNLKAVADTEHEPAGAREALDCAHHRRKTRNRAGAQIVAERKSAGENDGVEAGNFLRLVPDEFDGLPNHGANRVIRIIVAIRSRKLHDSEFHAFLSLPELILAYRLQPIAELSLRNDHARKSVEMSVSGNQPGLLRHGAGVDNCISHGQVVICAE
jgi:hypothetical protein